MADNKVNIKAMYRLEIKAISNKLRELEQGRVTEITRVNSDGYLSTNIVKLRDMLNDLLSKIQDSKNSDEERLASLFE